LVFDSVKYCKGIVEKEPVGLKKKSNSNIVAKNL